MDSPNDNQPPLAYSRVRFTPAPAWLRLATIVSLAAAATTLASAAVYRLILIVLGLQLVDLFGAHSGASTVPGWLISTGWIGSHVGLLASLVAGVVALICLIASLDIRQWGLFRLSLTAAFAAAVALYLFMQIGFVLAGI